MRTTDPGPEPALPRPAAPAQTTDSGPGPALPRPAAPALAADGARRLVAGLSVVLPCSGAQAAGVDEAIRATAAAAARSSLHYEIVVVDDGGGDETARAAARFVDGARPVRLLVHPHPRGYGAAVRTGLDAARLPAGLLARCRAEGARIAEHPIRHRPRASAARRRVRAGAAVAGIAELARRQRELRRLSRTVA